MKKVLIAEDDQFIAQAYQDKLKLEGMDVQIAEDGEAALAKIKSFKPDVIILDLVMPKMDGFEVLEKLASYEMKGMKVIVASNLSQDEDIAKAKKLGASDFMIKSDTSLEQMLAKVKG